MDTPIFDNMVAADEGVGHGHVLARAGVLRDTIAAANADDIYQEVQW